MKTKSSSAISSLLDAFTSWQLLAHQDEEKAQQLAENFYVSMFEPEQGFPSVKITTNDKSYHRVFRSFVEVMGSLHRLDEIPLFLKYSRRVKEKLSGTSILSFFVESYLQEYFILKERLCAFLNVVQDEYKFDDRVESIVAPLFQFVKSNLDKQRFLGLRRVHVHQARFRDDKIHNLGTFELLVQQGPGDDTEDYGLLHKWTERQLKEIKGEWINRMEESNTSARALMEDVFEKVNPFIIDSDGKLRIPPTNGG